MSANNINTLISKWGLEELDEKPPNSGIHHYTDYNGVKGILENKSLHLTSLSYLNDQSEFSHATKLFKDRISETVKNSPYANTEFFKTLIESTCNLSRNCIGVVCFSEDGNLLSQWRSYSNNGSGVSIRFDDTNLLKKDNGRHLYPIRRCRYKKEDKERLVDNLISELINRYNAINENQRNEEEKKLDRDFKEIFLHVAPLLKDDSFKEEKEWRLFTKQIMPNDENWSVLFTNNRISQYYNYIFDDGATELDQIVRAIMIGPSNNQESVNSSIQLLLRKYDYSPTRGIFTISVSNSKIPYRGR